MIRLADIARFVTAPEASMRDAMTLINDRAAQFQFQLVVDRDGRLVGTVTDGDVRRAILRGVGLDYPLTECMNRNPVVGQSGLDADNIRLLHRLIARPLFLPVVDGAGKVREILVQEEAYGGSVFALIMAGGLGTRLGEITKSTPKPLVQVAGKPILGHLLDRLENAGIGEAYVSAHYLAEQIEDFVAQRKGDLSIQVLREEEPLGTAGAIGLLPPGAQGQCMVMNGDVLTSLDFSAFQDFHRRHKYDATVAVAQHRIAVPFGVVRHDGDGQFIGIDEKPTLCHFVAAGIYCFSKRFCALVRPGEAVDMPGLLERGRDAGYGIELFAIHEYWTDVGRPEDLMRADRDHSVQAK